jgi:hypothetical protein
MKTTESIKPKPYMNPYLAGFLLGLVLLATIYITGRGLGASGAFKSVVIASVETVAPNHAENTAYYTDFKAENPEGPWKNFLVFEVFGVLVGAFFSGVLANRTGLKLGKRPAGYQWGSYCRSYFGRGAFWLRFAIGPRLYQRFGPKRNGGAFAWRNFDYAGHFWRSLCVGLLFQKTLVKIEQNGTISTFYYK